MVKLLDFLFPPRVDEVTLRGISDCDFLSLMSPRLVPETRPGTVALFSFSNPPVRSAIHEAKYHGSERAFSLLGSALAEYLNDCDERFHKPIIAPVPLGKLRLKERGYNQVNEVAIRALRNLDNLFVIDTNVVERVKETPTQVSLPREKREGNMRGAFSASPRLRRTSSTEVTKHTYIVIDDVVTTGATLQAAVDALKEAGAVHIVPLALAH